MKNKTKLIGSAGSLDALFKRVSEFFYAEKLELVSGVGFDGYTLRSEGKPIEGFRIIKKQNRFRFEMELQDEK